MGWEVEWLENVGDREGLGISETIKTRHSYIELPTFKQPFSGL